MKRASKKRNAKRGYRPGDLTGAAERGLMLSHPGAALLLSNPRLKIVWKRDGQYTWSAFVDHQYVGGVERDRISPTYIAYGSHAREVGRFRSLSAAKKAVNAEIRAVVKNPATRKNHHNDQAAIDAYRDFHGEDPQELIEFSTVHHYPGRTAALGDLVQLKIRIPRERSIEGGRVVTLKDFGEAWLTRHPTMRQLYAEGGDQSIDLEEFGLDSKNPNEVEYLGELTRCLYFTRKVHLGREGGTANYDHKFGQVEGEHELGLSKTELIKVGYHVPDERLIFMGGGYTIPAEGIDG